MKVLLVSCRSDDYLSSCLRDGFCEVLGPSNVFDPIGVESFRYGKATNPCNRISSYYPNSLYDGQKVDLIVINACTLRQMEWDGIAHFVDLNPQAKIAFVEGWDSASEFHNPPFPCDAYFRRELDLNIPHPYPKEPHCLMFSAPRRWFLQNDERPFDCFYAGNVFASEFRWEVLEKMWQTKTKHRSIGASIGVDFENYFQRMSQFKLAICPVGAAECFDCMRTWEVIAAGCIPIFVGFFPRMRDPWLPYFLYFKTNYPVGLTEIIDNALATDLRQRRHDLQDYALIHHTTAARARRVIELTGLSIA